MTMDNILNGNNNYVEYNYNIMEEYDYYIKTINSDECRRCRQDLKGDSATREQAQVDNYPYITECIQDRVLYDNFKERWQPSWSFSSFKAKRTKGDYKLQGWWDKFRGELYKYNGVRDVRGYMINISPKWPEKYSMSKYCVFLENAILKFSKTGKWKEFHYVLEVGKDGDHLHAHCVCIPTDPKLAKTYISKGNHYQWFKREFDNENNNYPVGFVECCRGKHSIQIVSINNCEIYEDKLKYLQEETKPEDHKNKRKLMDMKVVDFS